MTPGVALAVAASPAHGFSKSLLDLIRLLEGLGVECDAHSGATVKHRSRVAKEPTQPNLRQVHLIHAELFEERATAGFALAPGALGENVTTRGIDLLALPRGARLHLGATAIVAVTGLRDPCWQIDAFRKGLMQACLGRDAEGGLVRKSGVMGVVVAGGEVAPGDAIRIALPGAPHERLGVV